jgi:translation elongation factor P/translation initiation factor 5A
MIPPKVGDVVAKRYLDGTSPRLELTLDVKDDILNLNISNKTFNLVMYSDNKYYVMENKSYSNDYPRIYVIRDDQVKVAVMKQAGDIDSWNYWL